MRNGIDYINLGPVPGYVGFCFKEESFRKEMKHLKVQDPKPWITPGADGTCHALTHPVHGTTAIVCIDKAQAKKRNPDSVIELMVHECTHAWQVLRDAMGERFPSSEFEAYTVAYLVRQCIRAYNAHNIRKR